MFPTIVGAWVLDGGEAGRRRFCYPKRTEPRRCTGWRMLGFSFVGVLGKAGIGGGGCAGREMEAEIDGDGRSESKSRRP